MKNNYLFIFLIISFISFGQNKFVGTYNRVLELKDTLDRPEWGYLYNKSFVINSDSSFFYYEEENPTAFTISTRETFEGTWISRGDTIIFYNRKFRVPKGIKFNYIENQNFEGIKIIVKDFRGEKLNVDWCSADSLSPDKNRMQLHVPYQNYKSNTILVTGDCYRVLHFRPHGQCADFRDCSISINLDTIKSGTLIEVTCHSRDMETTFNGKRYILTGNILHEISTVYHIPDARTDNFIKRK